MAKVTVRLATREDIEAFSDAPGKPTIKAFAAECEGRIIALGGCALVKGRWCAFCDLTEEARPHKMLIARSAIRFLKEAKRGGVKFIYAKADPREKTSIRWLTSLGFEIDPRSQYLYRWKP